MFSSRLYSSSFWFILFFLPAFSFPFILRYFFFLTLLSLRPCLFLFWYIFSLSLSSCILPSFISLSFSLLPSLSFFLQLPSLCSLLSFFFFFLTLSFPFSFPPMLLIHLPISPTFILLFLDFLLPFLLFHFRSFHHFCFCYFFLPSLVHPFLFFFFVLPLKLPPWSPLGNPKLNPTSTTHSLSHTHTTHSEERRKRKPDGNPFRCNSSSSFHLLL